MCAIAVVSGKPSLRNGLALRHFAMDSVRMGGRRFGLRRLAAVVTPRNEGFVSIVLELLQIRVSLDRRFFVGLMLLQSRKAEAFAP